MLKKSALTIAAVIAAMSISVPVMAQTDAPANNPARTILYSEAVNKNEAVAAAMDKTMYVTADQLFIRSIPSTEGEIIGSYYYGESVRVTGMTGQNGEAPGWCKVVRDNREGFVSAEFLTDAAPAAAAANNAGSTVQAGATTTNAVPAYAAPAKAAPNNGGQNVIKQSYVYAQDGSLVGIYKTADGKWHDYNGGSVTWVTDNQATTAGGQALTSFNPTTGPTAGSYPLASGFEVHDAAGNCQGTMTPYSDGNYYSNDLQRYEDNGDGTYYGAGETLYSDPCESDQYGPMQGYVTDYASYVS